MTMSKLPRPIHDELAAVVGARHLSDDASVTVSHDWWGLGADPSTQVILGAPPAVVVLPGSTEEVAGIVKVCNRHGLKFKAHSTGYGNHAGVGSEGAVCIDLRRMNRIEIDAKNRMAVIEPYATAGQLQAEAMKHHLMCHVIGAGPIHSPLASATSYAGVGVPGNHTGNNVRNMLSLEWVTPEGEIVRIGSAGSGAGWFTGEGPGPGFRGIIRGLFGTAGGLGVFTRIGYKLYPWAGPERLTWTGEHPQRGVQVPEHFRCHHLVWDTWEDVAEATYQLQHAKAVMIFSRTPPLAVGNMLAATNRGYYDAKTEGRLPPAAQGPNGTGWTVVLMAWSAEELAWKEAVLDTVLAQTKGRRLAMVQLEREILAANCLTSLYVARFCRMSPMAGVSMGVLDSVALIPKAVRVGEELLGDDQQPGGRLIEADTEQNWMWMSEGRHFWTENNPPAARFEVRSIVAAVEFILRSFIRGEKDPVGITFFLGGPAGDLFGPGLGNAQVWMRRVKHAFDPRNLCDSKGLLGFKPGPEAKVWPIVKRVLFHPRLAPLLRVALGKQFK
jgi:glycolate oxidase